MILKGNQRGGGQQLAVHLMNSFTNERVEVAEIRGSVAQDLSGAFTEWAAQAQAVTKIEKKYFYHLSLNPDQEQGRLTREQYFELLERTERSLKLVGQPRAVVFHEIRNEKGELREHAHAVWSRADTDKMRAVDISHDRLRLRTVARDFARDHGLELPEGMKPRRSKDRNVFNEFAKKENHGERQQKERSGISKTQRVADIATCWKETGSGAAFVQAMEGKGYFLARGDKRDYVVIDLHGEIHSLSRQLSGLVRKKELVERLIDFPADNLPGVEDGKAWAKKQREEASHALERAAQEKQARQEQEQQQNEVQKRLDALKERQAARRADLDRQRVDLIARHLSERGGLKAAHDADNTGIVSARLQKQPKGLMAFLRRITGVQMFIERRDRRQDQIRVQEQKEQADALQRRHDRELAEIERRTHALARLEVRENRSAATALSREEFERLRARVIEIPIDRKPAARELKPDFDRVAHEVYARTGTDDGRPLQAASTGKADGNKPEKGTLVSLFKRALEALHPEPPKPPAPEPVRVAEEFEKAAKPPIDLTEEFNREVEYRRTQEERDRDYDGPDRDFDPAIRSGETRP